MALQVYTCKRCGWNWKPRTDTPVKCPNCTSRFWNKKTTITKSANAKE